MLPPLTLPDDGNEYGPDLLGEPAVIGHRDGLPDWRPQGAYVTVKLRLARLKLTKGGLAANGARFRRPQPALRLYHAESLERFPRHSSASDPADLPASVVRLFVWASDRKAAKGRLRFYLPNCTFYR